MILFENATLKISIFANEANHIVEVNILELTREGKIVVEEYEIKTIGGRTEQTFLIELPHAELKALTIKPKEQRFPTTFYAKASLQKGKGLGAKELITLLSGYFNRFTPLTYPPILNKNPLEGPGTIFETNISATGISATLTVPDNTQYKIISAYGVVTANAVNSNNFIMLRYGTTAEGFHQLRTFGTFSTPSTVYFTFHQIGENISQFNDPFVEAGVLTGLFPNDIILTSTLTVDFNLSTGNILDEWNINVLVEDHLLL